MFEEGNLLLFHPFLFKNGAPSKDKFFSFSKNTFVYGSNLDVYQITQFEIQERMLSATTNRKIAL